MTATQGFEAIRAFDEHEHRELRWGLGQLHEAADLVGAGSHVQARLRVHDVVSWLARALEPHIAWEEGWLYPQIERITGTSWAIQIVRFDHGQIAALIAQLRTDATTTSHSLTPETTARLRTDLLRLEALLRAHIDREEQLVLPLLESR